MTDGREFLAAKVAAHKEARIAFDRARAQGVQCTRCGGNIALPDDLTLPQFPCRFCGTLLATSQYVAPELLLGAGMRAKIDAVRAEASVESKRRDKYILIGAGILALVILAAVFVPLFLGQRR